MKKTMKINPELFDSEKYDEHKVEESAEILLEADEIKKDPVLMKAIDKYLAKKKDKITSLQDLKEKANNFSSEQNIED